jgi:hypothetical protein
MNKKEFIEIINEEIKNFDFLGNDEFLKEQEVTDLLQNEDLQKQFICDSLLNRKDKVKIVKITDSYISGNWDEFHNEDADRLSLEYSLDMEYLYDSQKEPLKFNLYFSADKIDISVGGWYDPGQWGGTMADAIEPSGESWYDGFDWDDISVTLFTMDGDDVPFTAFDNAPPRIQTLFIREYTQNFIENETLELRTQEIKDKVQDIPYC